MRQVPDKELQRLITLSSTRGAIFNFCGVKMFGNKNPDPPEALAADILHIRRIWVRLSKIQGLIIDPEAKEILDQIGDRIEVLNEWLELALETVNEAWINQNSGGQSE